MEWTYGYQKPTLSARMRTKSSDFQVVENLGFEPEENDRGQHFWLYIEKIENNTEYVARALAKFADVANNQVSFSGLKDRHAVTRQWYSVELTALSDIDWGQFELENTKILKVVQSVRKLRRGTHKSNAFKITLRELQGDLISLFERLEYIKENGVPNYFGEQRFGRDHHNLAIAESIFSGKKVKNRQAKSMALSAARSWVFNHYVSQRIASKAKNEILAGDVMQLMGSHSVFTTSGEDIEADLKERMAVKDIRITGPMIGRGDALVAGASKRFEEQVIQKFENWVEHLSRLGLDASRRPIWLYPEGLKWELDNDVLILEFILETGTFATSVIREIADTHID